MSPLEILPWVAPPPFAREGSSFGVASTTVFFPFVRAIIPSVLRSPSMSFVECRVVSTPRNDLRGRLLVHGVLARDLIERPRDVALAARRIQGGRDDLVDRPSADQVLQGCLSIEHGGTLPDMAREAHLRSHRVDLRQALREGSLSA